VKRYDRAYFDRWYRRQKVNSPAEVRRKVALAVAECEYFLHRPLRDVLDVGCGEGAWLPHLRALRPAVQYLGVDPSDYAVNRFGRSRNIVKGSFAGIASLHLERRFDLIVCSDVLHYVPDDELRAGVPELVRLAAGVLFFEILTIEDEIVGDVDGLIRRPASWYREVFAANRLLQVGPYTWAAPPVQDVIGGLESIR
jgi:SAM-dependent methyltransferase